MSKDGRIRNRHSRKVLKLEAPKAEDPHKYVRLIMKGSPISFGHSNQRRTAVRTVVAHCWLQQNDFKLGAEGLPDSIKKVYYADKDPHNCSADNLRVLDERHAVRQGMALTSRYGSRESKLEQRSQRQQQPMYHSTPPEVLRQACEQQIESDMSWPAEFDMAGRPQ